MRFVISKFGLNSLNQIHKNIIKCFSVIVLFGLYSCGMDSGCDPDSVVMPYDGLYLGESKTVAEVEHDNVRVYSEDGKEFVLSLGEYNPNWEDFVSHVELGDCIHEYTNKSADELETRSGVVRGYVLVRSGKIIYSVLIGRS